MAEPLKLVADDVVAGPVAKVAHQELATHVLLVMPFSFHDIREGDLIELRMVKRVGRKP